MSLRGGAALASLWSSASVQKTLELAAIAVFGGFLRGVLDAKALTTLLLKALVPAVILSSLAGLSMSPELLPYVVGGAALVGLQIASGFLAARALIGPDTARATIRRTAGVQVGTMAPVLSVFAFVREFVGPTRTGYAALIDLPSKVYMLVVLPTWLAFRGAPEGRLAPAGGAGPKKSPLAAVAKELTDPFNAAILVGLLLAATGTQVSDLGFLGSAIKTLASAQTPVLFLLIGLKFQLSGARPAFVIALLLARHGLIALGTAAFLALTGMSDPGARLATVLSSQAAASIVGYGQIERSAAKRPALGYDPALAFEIVGLSFPLTITLNTATCLIGAPYVDNLAAVGALLLLASLAMYRANKGKIDRM